MAVVKLRLPPVANVVVLLVGLGRPKLARGPLGALPPLGNLRQRVLARVPVAHQPASNGCARASNSGEAVDIHSLASINSGVNGIQDTHHDLRRGGDLHVDNGVALIAHVDATAVGLFSKCARVWCIHAPLGQVDEVRDSGVQQPVQVLEVWAAQRGAGVLARKQAAGHDTVAIGDGADQGFRYRHIDCLLLYGCFYLHLQV